MKNQKFCQNCKYWNNKEFKQFGYCTHEKHKDISEIGLYDFFLFNIKKNEKIDFILSSDNEMYGSYMLSGKDFKCIHYLIRSE